jgi:hypothetical protein
VIIIGILIMLGGAIYLLGAFVANPDLHGAIALAVAIVGLCALVAELFEGPRSCG